MISMDKSFYLLANKFISALGWLTPLIQYFLLIAMIILIKAWKYKLLLQVGTNDKVIPTYKLEKY